MLPRKEEPSRDNEKGTKEARPENKQHSLAVCPFQYASAHLEMEVFGIHIHILRMALSSGCGGARRLANETQGRDAIGIGLVCLPTDRDRRGCLADQAKLATALVQRVTETRRNSTSMPLGNTRAERSIRLTDDIESSSTICKRGIEAISCKPCLDASQQSNVSVLFRVVQAKATRSRKIAAPRAP